MEAAAAAGKIAEERNCSLTAKLEEAREELTLRNEQLVERDEQYEKLSREAATASRNEQAAVDSLAEKEAELKATVLQLQEKTGLLDKAGVYIVHFDLSPPPSKSQVNFCRDIFS